MHVIVYALTLLIVIFIVLLVMNNVYLFIQTKQNNYPPGPMYPLFCVIMYALFYNVQNDFRLLLTYLQEKYGAITMVYFFNKPTVIIHDLKLFQQTFKHQSHSESFVKTDFIGLTELSGNKWKKRRQINHDCFGPFVKSCYLDNVIQRLLKTELFPILNEMSENNVQYKCREDIRWLLFAIMFGALFGKNINNIPKKEDKDYIRFANLANKAFDVGPTIVFMNNFIPNKRLNIFLKKALNLEKWDFCLKKMIETWSKQLRKQYQVDQDTYFYRMHKYVQNEELNEREMCADAGTLYQAALHTTMSVTESTLLYAAKYYDIQEQVYNELKDFYKRNNKFELKKINELHIFRAFLYESIRFGLVALISLPRNIIDNNLKIGSYIIPKGSMVIGSITSIHRNKEYWSKPNEFYIKHFLDENNNFKKPSNGAFIAFGYGKRNCFGMNFAIKELYSILVPLLYHYRLSVPNHIENNAFKIPQNWFQENVKELPLIIEKRTN
eukprot:509093_1